MSFRMSLNLRVSEVVRKSSRGRQVILKIDLVGKKFGF